MCNFNNGFVLCSCTNPANTVHNKNSRRYKKENKNYIAYNWILNRYVGPDTSGEMGRYLLPETTIGCGLTDTFVVDQLNNRNCFDFEYPPTQGDNLILYPENKNDNGRIEFIFKNGNWIIDHYSPFNHIAAKMHNGTVQNR